MSLPRQVLPKQFYLVTRSCTQQQFLLRPDDATNNAFLYCLAVAALRYGVQVLMSIAESNHHHTVIFDPDGRVSQFVEYFHKLVARSQNALRGRWENFWAAGEPCITRLLDRQAVIDKLIYTASNPVKDHLVQRVHHWPGANTYSSFLQRRRIEASRPRHFFRNPGPMPTSVSLDLCIPPELGPAEQVIREVRAGVEAVEQAILSERRSGGAPIVGRRRVLAQSWKGFPGTLKPRRVLRPRFAGNLDVRIPALASYRAFLSAYRVARKLWLAGFDPIFPEGTYWLARFARIPKPGVN